MAPVEKRGGSTLSLPVTNCKGVGPKTASLLQRIGIVSVGHLLYHFPRAYLDRRTITPITSVRPSQTVVVQGTVSRMRCFRPSRRLHITQCEVRDDTGCLKVVWFNQPYIRKSLPVWQNVILSGSVSMRNGLQLQNPDIEVLSSGENDLLHTKGLIPVYPLTERLGQKKLRRLVRAALDDFLDALDENLPARLIETQELVSRREALGGIHFPHSLEESRKARERIAFEEFLGLQLHIQSTRGSEASSGIAHNAPSHLTSQLSSRIPFALTHAQSKAIEQIFRLMELPKKMNVLLQGDVGSGKTVVAAHAMLKAIENSKQAILMAPTEILAEQHLSSLRDLMHGMNIKTVCLTAGRSPEERKRTLGLMASGVPCMIVGTHALIQEKVSAPNTGLVIIDEQHRFGVSQRAALSEKGLYPDLIVMTATPIPRTLALTLYGNFQNILIDEYPAGRHPVETRHVSESGRGHVLELLRKEIAHGKQAFIICPEIGEEHNSKSGPGVSAAKAYADYTKAFHNYSIGLLHGKMSPQERENTLLQFRNNRIHILIATTIIEVGMNVPNASVIIIESADQFGLTQLHQLRGRVGRSRHKSYCFLMGEPATEEAMRRIEIMTSTNDGFRIAEQDLLLRGPGELIGTAQSGLPPLRVGHLLRDASLMEQAREAAIAILASDPSLESAENSPLRLLLGKPTVVHL